MNMLRLGFLLALLLCPAAAAAMPINVPETVFQPFTGLATPGDPTPVPVVREGAPSVSTAVAAGEDIRRTNRLSVADELVLSSSFEQLRPATGSGPETAREDDPGQATQPQPREASQSAQSRRSARNEARLRDLIRLFVTAPAMSGVAGPPSRGPPGAASGPASLLFEAVLDITFDAEAVSLIHEIVQPALSPLTITNFSIAAIGNFIIVFLRETSGFSVVDLDSGTRLSMHDTPGIEAPMAINARPGAGGRAGEQGSTSMTFAEFLDLLHEYFLSYLLHPVALTVLMLAGVFWIAWRLQGRDV